MMEPILTPAGEAALTELIGYLSIITICFLVVFIGSKLIERAFNE